MKKMVSNKFRQGLCALALTAASTATFASMAELESSVDSKNYKAAYALAQKMVTRYAGMPRFDYYLGMAALNTGNFSEAVFAFERATINDPNNMHAQLGLGESYIKAGQVTEGQETLNSLLQRHPPESMSTRAQQLLKYKVSSRDNGSSGSAMQAYVDISGGNDSNINSAAEIDSPIVTPLLVTVGLDPDSVAAEDSFTQYTMGAAGAYKSRNTSMAAGISIRDRQNSKYSEYDTTVVTSYIGFSAGNKKHRVYIPVYHQDINLDGNDYYTLTVSGLGYRFYTRKNSYVSLAVETGSHTYEVLTQRDSKTTTTSLSWRQRFKGGLSNVSLYGGDQEPDKIQAGINDYFARSFTGLSAFVEGSIAKDHALYGTARYEASKYDDAVYPDGFNNYRDDSFSRYAIGWKWKFYQRLMLRVEYNTTENDSNIPLQAYDRTQYLLGLRYSY